MEPIHGKINLSKFKSKIVKVTTADGKIIKAIVINLKENNLQLNEKYPCIKYDDDLIEK